MGDEQHGGDGPEKNPNNDLIVALEHVGLVQSEFDALGIALSPESPEESELLGLARLGITNLRQAASAIVDQVARDPKAQARLAQHPKPAEPMDQVLWGLRGITAGKYAGWVPTLGKNRLVGRVHGVGAISHGSGDTDPEPYIPSPPPPSRAAGPGQSVRVGVLDTGLFPQQWLAGGWAARFSDTVQISAPLFAEGHGTFVTGLILTQAPGATVEVRRVLGEDGTADSWTVAEEIVRFGRSGLDVLNLSFLCYTEDGQPPLVLSAAIDRLDPDLVVVAAAGNHGDAKDDHGVLLPEDDRRKPAWPAALDDVLAVGACDEDGHIAPFSPVAPWVDVHAPGVMVGSTYLQSARSSESETPEEFGGFARWSGTSFSAALVSGAVAASTQPGRVSAKAALSDIMRTLKKGSAPKVPDTESLFLKLSTI